MGGTGEAVSVIGFGAWPIGGGMGGVAEREAIGAIHAAIEGGITLIDSAQMYRSSESVIGKALDHGRRERVFLATKVSGDYSRAAIRSAVEQSLKNLRTDRIDLYQIHSWNDRYPIEESMEEMQQLKTEGKVRYLGVSNFTADQMKRALKTARFESSQPRYNVLDREIEEDSVDFCREHHIGILAHSVLAKGLLTGKYEQDYTFPPEDERSSMARFHGDAYRDIIERVDGLKLIAQELNITVVQLAIAWVLRLPEVTCALVGAKSGKQVEQQLAGAEIELESGILDRIDVLFK